jgi:SAM-dependent methyltransferase
VIVLTSVKHDKQFTALPLGGLTEQSYKMIFHETRSWMAKIVDETLGVLRRTIIPPMWSVFRRMPGGMTLWTRVVNALGIQPGIPVAPADVRTLLANLPTKFKSSLPSVAGPQTNVHLCKLSDLPEFDNPEWTNIAAEMKIPTTGTERLVKKLWEYTHVVYGLKQLGCLKPSAKVLSVGSGFEIPFFYIATQVGHAYGIDLFEGVEDPQAEAKHTERYASFPVKAGCFTMQRMDGRHLEFSDNAFDVVFSLSSIEHFGGHAAAAQAMREMSRVLKPGGVAAVATELILNGIPEPNFFLPDEFIEYVVLPSGLSVIGDVDFSLSPSLIADAPQVSEIQHYPYIAIYWGRALFTSIMVFLKKT